MAESKIIINGQPPVPLSSLTPEEKAACWEVMAKRIGQAITDYVNRHPEQYELVRKALLDAGGREVELKP